jgi:RNA polymerase sigma-70 factor (ECF subfamily)
VQRTATDKFTDFVRQVEPKLGDALVAALGSEVGREATEEALIYAWQHWERVSGMENPSAYLYRVGRSKAKRYWRRPLLFPEAPPDRLPMVEPKLAPALAGLSEKQRTAVLLMHGFGWTHSEVAEFLNVAVGTVQKHVERAMAKLRDALEVEDDS